MAKVHDLRGQKGINVMKRECGDCNVCCTTHGVVSLQKKAGTACVHCTQKGCGIYASRPHECRNFTCAWLSGRLKLTDEYRPDKLGAVVEVEHFGTCDGVLKVVKLFAVRENALQTPQVEIFMQHWLACGVSIYLCSREPEVRRLLGVDQLSSGALAELLTWFPDIAVSLQR